MPCGADGRAREFPNLPLRYYDAVDALRPL
jgi:hypothetical protein